MYFKIKLFTSMIPHDAFQAQQNWHTSKILHIDSRNTYSDIRRRALELWSVHGRSILLVTTKPQRLSLYRRHRLVHSVPSPPKWFHTHPTSTRVDLWNDIFSLTNSAQVNSKITWQVGIFIGWSSSGGSVGTLSPLIADTKVQFLQFSMSI